MKESYSLSEGQYVENAGLVILHPFLSALFDKLGIIRNNEIISLETQRKGISLLHYLSFSRQSITLKQNLNTFFCGFPLPDTMAPIALTQSEMKECDKLLLTVIEYWKALKSISVEELQTSFIQRRGNISEKEDFYLLKMEYDTVDILLEKLPWSYGVIKFPWLTKPLNVEW